MTRRDPTGATAALWLSLALIVALLGGVSAAVTPVAAANASVDGGTITQCGTIDETGRYELGGDLTVANAASCLTVTADGVTIDGAGHTVDGVDDDALSYGLVVEAGADDVTVTDLTVRGWEQGVRVRGDGFTGRRITATRNGEVGVAMFGTTDATLEDSTVTENGDTGVYTTGASGTRLADLTARDHGTAGVHIDSDGGGSVVSGGTVSDSGQFGVRVTDGSGPTVDGTTVSATAEDPTVDGDGVGVYTSASGTVVEGATVTGSATHGVHVVGGDEAADFEVRNVTARANGGDGVRVDGTLRTTVSAVTARENRDGVNLTDATRPTVSGVVVTSNDRHGVGVGGGSAVALDGVEAAENGAWAVHLADDPGAVTVTDLVLESATLEFTANDVAVGPAPVPGGDRPAGERTVGAFFNATTTASEGGGIGGTTGGTGGYLDVVVSYTEADASSVVQSTLGVTRYAGGDWTTFESTADADANTVSANLTDPAAGVAGGDVFGPLGDLEGAIVECTTIDAPGEFVLDANLTGASGTCLTVASDDVSLLGHGHRLAGDDTGTGVLVDAGDAASNVTVRGLEVGGFARGIALSGVDGATIRDVNASENVNVGVVANDSTELTLDGVTAESNGRESSGGDPLFGTGASEAVDGVGLLLSNVDGATLTDTTARENRGEQVALVDGTVADVGPVDVGGTRVTLTDARDVTLSPVDDPEPSEEGYDAVGTYVNVSATSDGARATVTLGYDESAVGDEAALVLGKFDGEWTYLEGVDPDADTVTAHVTSFSQFVVMESQDDGSGGSGTPTPTATPTPTPTATPTPGGDDGGTDGTPTLTPTPAPTPTSTDDGGESGSGDGSDGSDGDSGGGGGGSGAPAGDGGSADVVVVDSTLNRSEMAAGETVRVTVTVENEGDARGEHEVKLSVGERFVQRRFVTLDPGERGTVEFERTFSDAGTYELRTDDVEAGTLEVSAPAEGSGEGSGADGTPTPAATATPTTAGDSDPDAGTGAESGETVTATTTATPTGTVAPASGERSVGGTPLAPASLGEGSISALGLTGAVVAIGGAGYLVLQD
jgi:hypothetical protein